MNDNIKKLAMQLSTDVEYREDIPWNDPRQEPMYYWFSVNDLDRFVTSIVQECADVCYHRSNAAGGSTTVFGLGYKECGDDIKKTLGVE
jgi:hypothetical protein